MTPYQKRGHSKTFWLTILDRRGAKKRLPTGTHDLDVATDMETMLRALGRRRHRHWDLVAALFEKDPAKPRRRRLALDRLYDAWKEDQEHAPAEGEFGALDRLRAELADVNLAPSVDEWLGWVEANRSAETVHAYRIRMRRLAPFADDGTRAPLWRSTLTPAWVAAQRDQLPGAAPSKFGHLTAWSSWCTWLVERGLLRENPCARVKKPRPQQKGDRVCHIARFADVQRFVAAFPTIESRAIAALREAVGADWDGLEPMRREHVVDAAKRIVFLPGDKTGNRAREVEVEAWAWKHVAAYLADTRDRLPGAPMFTLTYEQYRKIHVATRDGVIAAGVAIPARYTPHNARHSFGVRKRRAGWEDWAIAAYLGNTAEQVRDVYGAFTPTRADLAQDDEGRRKAQGES